MGGLALPFLLVTMQDINEIRKRLGELKPLPRQTHYEYYVDKFKVTIFTHKVQDHSEIPNDNILSHSTVDIQLYEVTNRESTRALWDAVYMYRDTRFMNYQPIKYGLAGGRNDGGSMPIHQLCELIKYLHRLSNLTAFL